METYFFEEIPGERYDNDNDEAEKERGRGGLLFLNVI